MLTIPNEKISLFYQTATLLSSVMVDKRNPSHPDDDGGAPGLAAP